MKQPETHSRPVTLTGQEWTTIKLALIDRQTCCRFNVRDSHRPESRAYWVAEQNKAEAVAIKLAKEL